MKAKPSNLTPVENGIRPSVMIILGLMLGVIIFVLLWHHRASAPHAGTEVVVENTASTASATQAARQLFPQQVRPAPATDSSLPNTNVFVPLEISAQPSGLEDAGGLKVYSVALARAGMVVEVRYQITDTNKALSLASSGGAAYLVDVISGTRVVVGPPPQAAKMNAQQRARSAVMLKQASGFPPSAEKVCQAGRIYSVLVPNPGNLFRKKNKAYLEVGGLRSANLSLE